MPPEPNADPDVEANAAAWDCIPGSEAACFDRISSRIERKRGFSVRESGVGGILEVVPMDRDWEVGDVGRRVRMCEVDGDIGFGKTYCARQC